MGVEQNLSRGDTAVNNILSYNTKAYNNEAGMGYSHKPTQQKRIEIVVNMLSREHPTNGQNLLSLGCSTGDIEATFKQFDLQIHGVDGAPIALGEAYKKGVIVNRADVSQTLPYKTEAFDYIFAGEIIEHVMHTRSFLSEAHRVLKPSGAIILTTPNLARVEDRLRFLLGKSPKHTTPIHDYLYLHIRPFTSDSLKKALEFCGFTVSDIQSNYVYLGGIKAGKLSRMLAVAFPGLGKTLIVKAHKNRSEL